MGKAPSPLPRLSPASEHHMDMTRSCKHKLETASGCAWEAFWDACTTSRGLLSESLQHCNSNPPFIICECCYLQGIVEPIPCGYQGISCTLYRIPCTQFFVRVSNVHHYHSLSQHFQTLAKHFGRLASRTTYAVKELMEDTYRYSVTQGESAVQG